MDQYRISYGKNGDTFNVFGERLVRCFECALYHSRECVWSNAKEQDDYDFCSRAERAVIK